ncbi:hypothetical protein J4220_02405 [Candidatus Micrarchaeota archaeon]|nr:hypothetical protein [Candidatus Micrarchaeota archaeon]
MVFDAQSLVLLVFIFVAIGSYTSGGFSTDSPLIWGPALFVQIPFALLNGIASNVPLLIPIAIIALLAYFDFLTATLGEAFLTLVVFGAVIVMLGV